MFAAAPEKSNAPEDRNCGGSWHNSGRFAQGAETSRVPPSRLETAPVEPTRAGDFGTSGPYLASVDVHPPPEGLRGSGPRLRPVWTDILCDAQTPVGAFARLRSVDPTRFLLESVVGGERWARYSIIGVGHRATITGRVEAGTLRVAVRPGPGFTLPEGVPEQGVGLEALRRIVDAFTVESLPELPRFWGGLVGVWGHDFVRSVERIVPPEDRPAEGRSPLPALELIATDTVVVFDNLTAQVKIVTVADPLADGGPQAAHERACQRLEKVRTALLHPTAELPVLDLQPDVPFEVEPAKPWTSEAYRGAVKQAKEHIAAGDIFQVVLSQGFEIPTEGVDLIDVYRILRVTNPAPYMYLMELPSATLIGASPEVLVRVDRDDRTVTVRPIAGTRPRGKDAEEDRALQREMLADTKEISEHVMLMDLGRNDVGRVCVGGSVRMVERFGVELYSRVMHIVSEVAGTLRPELDALDALGATFPAGTLSGAPKVRALEIIDELELDERGWYGGAVGYLGYDGGADFAICIRSIVAHDDVLHVRAGAGIVYDSDPSAEDTECRNKASAVFRAIAMAKAGRKPT